MFHRKLLDEKKAGVLFGEGKMVMVDGMNRINSSIFWCSPKRFVRRKMATSCDLESSRTLGTLHS